MIISFRPSEGLLYTTNTFRDGSSCRGVAIVVGTAGLERAFDSMTRTGKAWP